LDINLGYVVTFLDEFCDLLLGHYFAMRRNTYLAFVDKMNNLLQRFTHTSIIDDGDQCVNGLDMGYRGAGLILPREHSSGITLVALLPLQGGS
jgi:hypothetical protein